MATGPEHQFSQRLAEMRSRMVTGERAATEIAMVMGDELVADPLFASRPAVERAEVLDTLAMTYYQRHLGTGRPTDLERALALYRRAVAEPSGDPSHDQRALNNLAICLSRRFQLAGDAADAAEMLAVARRLVDETPDDSPALGGRLTNLGVALTFHAPDGDSDEILDVHRRAVAVTAPDDPDRAMYEYNLGSSLLRRHETTGDPRYLEEAVETLEVAVTGSDPDSADTPARYANLARAYWARGGATDRETAVDLIELSIRLFTADVPERRLWRRWREDWLAELAGSRPQTVAEVLGEEPGADVVMLVAVCSCLGGGLPLEAFGDAAGNRLARAERWLAVDDDGVLVDQAVRPLLGVAGIGGRAVAEAVEILRRRFAPELDGEPTDDGDVDPAELADGWQDLTFRVARIGSLCVRFGINAISAAELVEQVADLASGYGDLPTALPLYELAVPLRAGIHGPEHSKVAGVRLEYGTALWRSGAPDAARGQVTAALDIFERVLGADDGRTAGAAMQLGTILQHLGEPDAALALMHRAVDSFRAYVGPLNRDLATPLQNLGTLLRDLGRRDEALPQLELAVALCRLGPPSMTGAIALDNLGTVFFDDGQYAVARACFERVLEEYEYVRPTAQDLSVTYHNLGRVLARLGERDAALEYLEAAIHLAAQAGQSPKMVQGLTLERAAIERADPADDPPPTAPVEYVPRSAAARRVQLLGEAMRAETAGDVRRFAVEHPEVSSADVLADLAEQARAFRRHGRHDAAETFEDFAGLLAGARHDAGTTAPAGDRPPDATQETTPDAVLSEFGEATAALFRYRDSGDPADLRLGIERLLTTIAVGRPAAPPAAAVNNLGWAHAQLLAHSDADEAADFLALCEDPPAGHSGQTRTAPSSTSPRRRSGAVAGTFDMTRPTSTRRSSGTTARCQPRTLRRRPGPGR